jgi:hypothetical protein
MFLEKEMEQRRIKWVEEEVKKTEAHSAGSKDVESQFVVAVVVAAAAAVSEPEFDLVLPMKQVEVELVSVIVPMNHDPTHIEEEAAVGGGASAADVAVPEPKLGPIHFDLHLGQRLKMLVGGWCYSIVAMVESEVAAEDWKHCQKEATHLPPNQYDHRLLQTLHYLCPLLLLPLLLTHEQRVHDLPQTRNEEHLPHDYLSADRQVAKKLHPQHPVAKEVTAVTGGGVLFSVSIYPYH